MVSKNTKKMRILSIFVIISSFAFIIITAIFVESRNTNARLITKYNNLFDESQDILQQIVKLPPHYIGDVNSIKKVRGLTGKVDNKFIEQIKTAKHLEDSPLTGLFPFYQKKYKAISELSLQRHKTMLAYDNFYNEASKTVYDEEKLLSLNENILQQEKETDGKASINGQIGPTPPVIDSVLETPLALLILAATILLGTFSIFGGLFLSFKAFVQRTFLFVSTWFILFVGLIFCFYLLFIAMTSLFY